ncbi:Type VI secretion system effector, Hcp1 [Candidatus Magnetomorum sp. HK-1]|nr:Type VI secretion system effector, Hcp1 [Candidatus Magnetomorum sp. HK-1]
MPTPAYMKIEGIPGSVEVSGREETVQILAFDHKLHIPVDRKDGKPTGTRVHGNFYFTKTYDKSSPELYNCLCQGKDIPKIELFWYEIKPSGSEEVYFTHTLEDVRVVEINAIMPDVDDPAKENYKHMERVGFRYKKITWKYEEGNIESSDSWLEDR